MTRDEVMAMTDKALRIMAAELVGWTDINLAGQPVGVVPGGGNDDECYPLPDYPHDISAAWELWDAILSDGKHTMEMFSRKPGAYAVVVGHERGPQNYKYEEDIEEASAALAITRAFVLTMDK